jgi:transcription antitermination factor NusB
MVTAATRRESRERAVELLYEAESKGIDVDDIVADLPLTPDAYALELAHGVTDHRIELDALLGRYARRWPVARMAVTDRTVLRIGALELATKLEIPTGAALSEAVELGARYGSTDDTSKFVNGVLASVGEDVRGGARDGARPWVPVDTVVFDMDGVIRHWVPEYLADAEQRLGLVPGAIGRAAFAEPLFREAMTGVRTVDEWAARIGEAVAAEAAASGEAGDVDPDAVAAVWLATTWQVDEEVLALARALREAGTTVGLFSNASTKLEADLTEMELSEAFDVVANSSRLGVVKPDAGAFERVAELVRSAPERTLFVDDRPENVAGAVAFGWHAVQMRDAARLAGVVRRLDVAGAPGPA